MKKLTAILLCGAIALSLSACGSSSGGSKSFYNSSASSAAIEDATADMAAPQAMEEYSIDREGNAAALPADRKIIKTLSVTLETQEFDQALESIRVLIEEKGGYIESSYQSNGSWSGGSSRYCSITARIPAQELASTSQGLEQLAHVTDRSEEADDITDQYYDADAHLAALEAQEARLLELVAQAETMEDLITLETALTDIRYQIESLTAQLRRYDSQVAYSTLNLDLREVSDLSVVRNTPTTFGEKVAAAAEDSIHLLVTAGQFLILAIVTLAPLALVILAVAAVVLAIVRAARRRKKAPPSPPWNQQPPSGDPPSPPQS